MSRNRLALAALCLTTLVSTVGARNVVVHPRGNVLGQPTSLYTAEPFVLANNLLGAPASFKALTTPAGNKYYIIADAGSDTVIVTDSTFGAIRQRFNLGQNAKAAVITPDGRRLLVIAGTLRIFDTTTDNEIQSNLDVGSLPQDIAVSLDSTRAFVLSPGSNRLTAIDLNTNQLLTPTLTIPGQSTSVTVAPNGLVYVTAQNRVFEIDGRNMSIRTEIALNARPGRPVFTADGRYMVVPNQTLVTGSSIVLIDLLPRTVVGTVPNFGTDFEALVPVSNNRLWAFSPTTKRIYEVSLSPLNVVGEVALNQIGSLGEVVAMVPSGEVPTPRFMFVASNRLLYRIDVGALNPVGQLSLLNDPGAISYVSPAVTGTATQVLRYNETQTVQPGQTYLPLIIRALDSSGTPLANVPVTFLSNDPELILQGAGASTSADGYALVTAIAPNRNGNFTVTANVTGAGAVTFSLAVGGGGGGPQVGRLTERRGNGQVILEQFLLGTPIEVTVRDSSGNPVSGQQVSFNITAGAGTLGANTSGLGGEGGQFLPNTTCSNNSCIGVTDANGVAQVSFLATSVPAGFNFAQTTITASYGSDAVNFVVTAIKNAIGGQGGAFLQPELVKPLDDRFLTVQAGQTLAGAIQFRVFVIGGGAASQALPNVALTVTTGLDPATGVSARCGGTGTPLSDGTGLVTCDLVGGSRLGEAQMTASLGGGAANFTFTLRVTPGPPRELVITQGNNQVGNAGTRLQLALVATVSDGFGNNLSGVPVTWEVVTPGTATLQNTINTSDGRGAVSTLVVLGNVPGSHQIRVRAGNISTTFTIRVNANFGSLTLISGNNQVAVVNQRFDNALVVRLLDTDSRPINGASINFAVTAGSATVSSTASTNSDGQASVFVTAGAVPGGITITASIGNLPPVTFSLTSRLPGPQLSLDGLRNGASRQIQRNVAPGQVLIIEGRGIAPGVNGVVSPGVLVGPLPFSLAGVEVIFGNSTAPIYWVANVSGVEQVAVQVPYELAVGTTNLTVRVSGGSTQLAGVPVVPYAPGLFEWNEGTRNIAVLVKANGGYVSSVNRANRGEILRAYLTGLGQVTPGPIGTNGAGVANQLVNAQVVVGVQNAGTRTISARYQEGLIGVYVVEFEVPADAPAGDSVVLSMGVPLPDGTLVFTQGAVFPVQ